MTISRGLFVDISHTGSTIVRVCIFSIVLSIWKRIYVYVTLQLNDATDIVYGGSISEIG